MYFYMLVIYLYILLREIYSDPLTFKKLGHLSFYCSVVKVIYIQIIYEIYDLQKFSAILQAIFSFS